MATEYRIAKTFGDDWCPPIPGEVIDKSDWFMPSPEWRDWIHRTFIQFGSRLSNADHEHLLEANIGVLLTSWENSVGGLRVIGSAEMPRPKAGWGGARSQWQLERWFGLAPLDFLITLDARYLLGCSPGRLASVIEHELYHCGQAFDMFGCPRFSKKTGRPIYKLRPHDVEEFTGCWKRYGARNGAGKSAELLRAGTMAFLFDDEEIVDASCCCGTCGH